MYPPLMRQALSLVDAVYAAHSPRGYVVQLEPTTWQALAMEFANDCRVNVDYRDWDAVQIKNVRFVKRRPR